MQIGCRFLFWTSRLQPTVSSLPPTKNLAKKTRLYGFAVQKRQASQTAQPRIRPYHTTRGRGRIATGTEEGLTQFMADNQSSRLALRDVPLTERAVY